MNSPVTMLMLTGGLVLIVASQAAHAQSALPAAVKVPDGHSVMLETVGVGQVTYECRDKANAPGQTEWTFVGPKAVLKDRSGKAVGDYFGPQPPGRPKTVRRSPAPSWPWRQRARATCLTNWFRPARPKVKAP